MITRRAFIRAATGAAVLDHVGVRHAAAEPPPEVSRIRLTQAVAICTAPQLVAGELLKDEGFGDVQYGDINKPTLRAFMKATDVCALDPDRVVRTLVDRKWTDREDYARRTLRDLPYRRWREFNPEDTVRFYALRLHEAGMIKSPPQKIIGQGTDWRFITELRKELKG